MAIITDKNEIDNSIIKCCEDFVKRFHVNKLLYMSNANKEKGVKTHQVFSFLIGLVFTGRNLYTYIDKHPDTMPFGKDVVYRLLNKANINWESFLLRLSCSVISVVDRLTSEDRKSALIIDDSPYHRNRSKKVEYLSRCYDHAEHRYYKGLTHFNIGWSDGQTLIPVSSRLLGSGNDKNLLEGSHVKEDKRTLATKRRIAARTDKPELVLSALKAIKGTPAQTKYVVFDSWFTSPSSLLSINGLGYHVVARLKDSEKQRYLYDGENIPIRKIYSSNMKRRGRSRYLLSVMVEVAHENFIDTIPAKIVYIRDRTNKKNWIALISTDITLSEDEIVALYGKRWDIEPFHKVIKSYLHIENEFQVRSYDAMTAHVAVVMTRYMLLSLKNRENKDFRSVNDGFYRLCKELEDITFSRAFELIVSLFKQCLNEYMHLPKKLIDGLIDYFITVLPGYIKNRLLFLNCES